MLLGMHFAAERLRRLVQKAAAAGIHLGTSSWKYPGWLGHLYDEQRYLHRGKVAESRFDRQCLEEYGECFSTVCVDGAYYAFPTAENLSAMAKQVPKSFLFTFKVTEDITVRRFPNFPRYGKRAGMENREFLNADLFTEAFLRPCEAIRDQLGLLMFEFSRFYQDDYASGREFTGHLDKFLSALPRGWPYGVEIRNRNFLHSDYFAMLASHGVTHVFNSWDAMPPVMDQLAMPESISNPALVAARFLLRPGRSYEQAVNKFQPYATVQEEYPEGRQAGAALVSRGLEMAKSGTGKAAKTLVYVNNRLEGNALGTIVAMLEMAGLAE
jgi:uncharacterized protein YecE (DUF72 family)